MAKWIWDMCQCYSRNLWMQCLGGLCYSEGKPHNSAYSGHFIQDLSTQNESFSWSNWTTFLSRIVEGQEFTWFTIQFKDTRNIERHSMLGLWYNLKIMDYQRTIYPWSILQFKYTCSTVRTLYHQHSQLFSLREARVLLASRWSRNIS